MTEVTDVSTVTNVLLGRMWITQEKVKLYPHQMSTSHIQNTILMILDGRMARAGRSECSGLKLMEWVDVFNEELARRRTK